MTRDPAIWHHEAGHAVIAVELRLPLWFVNVTGAVDRLGEARLTSRGMDCCPHKLTIYALAGAAAHKKFRGGEAWPAEAAHDLQIARRIVEWTTRHPRSVEDAWTEHLVLAEAMVIANWNAIERVARELAWKGELVGTRVKQLMEATK